MLFGDKIKQLRIENNWTQDNVCKKLNISSGALSRYETNMYEPKSLELIKDFANLFYVTTDYLLGRSEIRNAEKELEKISDNSEILSYYNQLNEEGRQRIIDYTKDLIDMPKYTEKKGESQNA